jgi:hypothetical protein
MGAYLPDPWRVEAEPQPRDLVPFLRFISAHVQEHTSEPAALSMRDKLAFLRFLATHGLSYETVRGTVGQLVGERTSRVDRRRRAELLDEFQWDVFAHHYRRIRPRFATFFSNSTAHFQHLTWAEMESNPGESLVLDGYKKMDRLVARAFTLAGEHAHVVLCTALSQVANDDDAFDGFYRLRAPTELADALRLIGVTSSAPMMAGQCHFYFDSVASASNAAALLEPATLDGRPAFDVRQKASDLVVACPIFTRQPEGRMLRLPDGRPVSFDDLFYWNDAPREGTHHPDGILWIGSGPRTGTPRVPLTAVAPTLLSLLGVQAPPSMKSEPLALGIP